jgi:hypothetical protein
MAVAAIIHREARHGWDLEDCQLCPDTAREILAAIAAVAPHPDSVPRLPQGIFNMEKEARP